MRNTRADSGTVTVRVIRGQLSNTLPGQTVELVVGGTPQTAKTVNEFERMTKSLERQAAAQEAETAAVGKSVGEQAKLRAQLLLMEAARQAGRGPRRLELRVLRPEP